MLLMPVFPPLNRLLLLLSVFTSLTLADLTCKPYYAQGRSSNRYAMTFDGTSSDGYTIPTTYVIVGNPVVLSKSRKVFTKFAVETCNSTSLGISSFESNLGCDGEGCSITYHNYVRVISPKSGNCLTARPLKQIANASELYPSKCDPNPSTANQLFITYQDVVYNTTYNSGRTIYGPIVFVNFDGEQPSNPGFPDSEWDTAHDNKTIIFYPPGQDPTITFASNLV